jgi:hypothetical protein
MEKQTVQEKVMYEALEERVPKAENGEGKEEKRQVLPQVLPQVLEQERAMCDVDLI